MSQKPYYPKIHRSITERFNSFIVSRNGCWQWRSPNKTTGYGEFHWHYQRYLAHRFSYQHHIGPIPDGMQIDHLCRNRGCVNPKHLRVVTLAQNVLAGSGITAQNKRKTSCKNGHAYTDANTYKHNGKRSCRVCKDALSRTYAKRLRSSDFPCNICGKNYQWSGYPQPVTCSRSCALKLSHRTRRERKNKSITKLQGRHK